MVLHAWMCDLTFNCFCQFCQLSILYSVFCIPVRSSSVPARPMTRDSTGRVSTRRTSTSLSRPLLHRTSTSLSRPLLHRTSTSLSRPLNSNSNSRYAPAVSPRDRWPVTPLRQLAHAELAPHFRDLSRSGVYSFVFIMWAALREKVSNALSRCHTKRRAGACGHARPSFGMTPTF